jgi:hypothetical protein
MIPGVVRVFKRASDAFTSLAHRSPTVPGAGAQRLDRGGISVTGPDAADDAMALAATTG